MYVLQPGMVRCPCNESFTSRFITAVLHNRKETRYRKDTRRFDSEWRGNDDTGPFVLLNLKRERVPSPLHCSHDPLYKFQNGEYVYIFRFSFYKNISENWIFHQVSIYLLYILYKIIGNLEIIFFLFQDGEERGKVNFIYLFAIKWRDPFLYIYMK